MYLFMDDLGKRNIQTVLLYSSVTRLELGECRQDINSVTMASSHYGVSGNGRLKAP